MKGSEKSSYACLDVNLQTLDGPPAEPDHSLCSNRQPFFEMDPINTRNSIGIEKNVIRLILYSRFLIRSLAENTDDVFFVSEHNFSFFCPEVAIPHSDTRLASPSHVEHEPSFDPIIISDGDQDSKPGYPTVIVPFGTVPNAPTPPFPEGFNAKPAPFGVSFTGMACSEPRLIELAYAFEQATRRRVPPLAVP